MQFYIRMRHLASNENQESGELDCEIVSNWKKCCRKYVTIIV